MLLRVGATNQELLVTLFVGTAKLNSQLIHSPTLICIAPTFTMNQDW